MRKKDEFKFLAIATLLFIVTVSFHSLGVFAAFIPLAALFIKGYTQTPYYKLLAFSILGGVSAYLYGQLFVKIPYQAWKNSHGFVTMNSDSPNVFSHLLNTNSLLTTMAVIGVF